MKVRKIHICLESDRASTTLVEERIEKDDDHVKHDGSNTEVSSQVLEADCESPPINRFQSNQVFITSILFSI